MKIIDFHTHTFPDAIAAATVTRMSEKSGLTAFTDGSEAGLLASMRAAGIGGSVVLPVVTNPEKTAHINDFSARMNGKNGVYHLGGLHPDTPDVKAEARRCAAMGLGGVKVHPVYQRTDFDDIRFLRLLDAAGEAGLFVVTHAGFDVGFPGRTESAVPRLLNALKAVGPVTLVLAHMGGWKQWDEAAALAEYKNTYIDTAFSLGRICPTREDAFAPEFLPLLDTSGAMRLIRAFGADRVLFGTDSPWASQPETLAFVCALPLEPEEKANVLYKNAERLLGTEEKHERAKNQVL